MRLKKTATFAHAKQQREYSSAGSEHLPYKQRVLGSNPCTPTKKMKQLQRCDCFFYVLIFDGFMRLFAVCVNQCVNQKNIECQNFGKQEGSSIF